MTKYQDSHHTLLAQNSRRFACMKHLAVVALVGCGADGPPPVECSGGTFVPYVHDKPLAEFPDLRPRASVVSGTFSDPQGRTVTLTLGWGQIGARTQIVPLIDSDGHSFCPTLDNSFSATLDVVDPSDVNDGGWVCLGTPGQLCGAPSVTFSLAELVEPRQLGDHPAVPSSFSGDRAAFHHEHHVA
jgi:hypothetical protein